MSENIRLDGLKLDAAKAVDLAYQAGMNDEIELRSKRITELEAENAELRELAELSGELLRALRQASGWMHRWNQELDEVPYEVALDLDQIDQTISKASEKCNGAGRL